MIEALSDDDTSDDTSAEDDLEDEDDEETAPSAGSDKRALERRVLTAFRDDALLGRRAVEIAAVGDGVVELTGWVRSRGEASRASATAREVEGVQAVLNRLDVYRRGPVEATGGAREPARRGGVVRPVEPDGPAT